MVMDYFICKPKHNAGACSTWSSTRLAGLGGGGWGGGRGREALLGGAWAQRSLINLMTA